MRTNRANATDINKSPREVRYVWIFVHKDGTVTSCTSYAAVTRAIRRFEIDRVFIVDLRCNRNLILNAEEDLIDCLENLAETWRSEYFNFEWDMFYSINQS